MIFPKATWKGPVPNAYGPGSMGHVLGLVLHIMQSGDNGCLGPAIDGVEGCDSWFHNTAAQVSAHFGTGTAGELYQWVDTGAGAWAEVAGNGNWISIENSGNTGDKLLDSQVESVAQVLAWLHQTEGVPLQKTDSPARPGLGWHGMGGDAWGGHYQCPGQPILDQRDQIIARAQEIAGVPAAPPEGGPMPIYKLGDSGQGVRALQGALLALGWGSKIGLRVDGSYGPITDQAVRNFQAAHGIGGSDHFGPECWAALFTKTA